MASARLSSLQRHILAWLFTHGALPGHPGGTYGDLVRAMPTQHSNLSVSVRTLANNGLVTLAYTAGGHCRTVALTPLGEHHAPSSATSSRTQDTAPLSPWQSVRDRERRLLVAELIRRDRVVVEKSRLSDEKILWRVSLNVSAP